MGARAPAPRVGHGRRSAARGSAFVRSRAERLADDPQAVRAGAEVDDVAVVVRRGDAPEAVAQIDERRWHVVPVSPERAVRGPRDDDVAARAPGGTSPRSAAIRSTISLPVTRSSTARGGDRWRSGSCAARRGRSLSPPEPGSTSMTSAAKLVWWAKSDASTRRCSATVIQATAGRAVGDSMSRSPCDRRGILLVRPVGEALPRAVGVGLAHPRCRAECRFEDECIRDCGCSLGSVASRESEERGVRRERFVARNRGLHVRDVGCTDVRGQRLHAPTPRGRRPGRRGRHGRAVAQR